MEAIDITVLFILHIKTGANLMFGIETIAVVKGESICCVGRLLKRFE